MFYWTFDVSNYQRLTGRGKYSIAGNPSLFQEEIEALSSR